MLYNRVSTSENLSTQILFLSLSLSSLPLPKLSLLFFSSFFIFFLFSLLFSSSFSSPANSGEPGQYPDVRRTRRAAQARPRSAGKHQPRLDQTSPGQIRPNPGPLRGQLVRELSHLQQPCFIDGFLICRYRHARDFGS